MKIRLVLAIAALWTKRCIVDATGCFLGLGRGLILQAFG